MTTRCWLSDQGYFDNTRSSCRRTSTKMAPDPLVNTIPAGDSQVRGRAGRAAAVRRERIARPRLSPASLGGLDRIETGAPRPIPSSMNCAISRTRLPPPGFNEGEGASRRMIEAEQIEVRPCRRYGPWTTG